MSESNNKDEFPKQFKTFACEIRFYPALEIDEEIIDFHKSIRKDLPIYRRGSKFKKDETGLQEVRVHDFESENGNLSVSATVYNLIIRDKDPLGISDFIKEILKYSRIFFKNHFNSIGEIIFLGIRITLDFNFDALTRKLEEVLNFFEIDTNKNDIIEKNVYDFSLEKRYMIDDVNFKKFIGFKKDSKINIYLVNIDLDSNKGDFKFHPDKLNEYLAIHTNNLNTELKKIISKDLTEIFETKQIGD